MRIIKKAYLISIDNLKEPWHYEDCVGHGETIGEAKSDAWVNSELQYASKLDGSDVEFLDLKARRYKEYDIVEYDGQICKRWEALNKEWVKNRDAEALKLTTENPDSLFLVWAGCYGNWWGANRCGYSIKKINAGKYSAKEAYDIVRGSSKDRDEHVVLLDVDVYNDEIKKEIVTLNSRKEEINKEIELLKTKML